MRGHTPPSDLVHQAAVDEDPGLALDALIHRISRDVPAFAVLAPPRQRGRLLAWICRGRALGQAGVERGRNLDAKVAAVATRLCELARMFWPGSVRALRFDARLEDAAVDGEPVPRTWAEAAMRAEQRLRDLDRGDVLDHDGWADAWQRSPAPPDPPALLDQVIATLDHVIGEPDSAARTGLDAGHLHELACAARALRWLRGRVEPAPRWGVAMGRIRRASQALPRNTRLQQPLSPSFQPLRSWADLVLEDDLFGAAMTRSLCR